MENKKILMIKHSPLNVTFENSFYLNQLGNDVNKDEVIFIDVTSRNKNKTIVQDLSPFYIGPVKASDGMVAKRFENFWQFGKVYKGKTIFNKYISPKRSEAIEFNCSDELGNPTKEWFKLREYGYNETIAYRRPYKGIPLYHYYIEDNKVKRLDYIESRKKIYIPEYIKLVYNSKSYKYIKGLVDEGKTIAIIDFDAYNFYNKEYMKLRYERDLKKFGTLSYTLNDYLNINTMKDVINFPGLLAGHGFALKLLLEGDIEVKGDKIIDHIGVLD